MRLVPKKNSTKQKVLLLLLGGLALGLSRSPKGYYKILNEMGKEWRTINRRILISAISHLYKSKLVNQKENKDGTVTFILSDQGKKIALTYNLDKMTIPRGKWDKKWRLVIFDIPEKKKPIREALRGHLKRLGFIELQHSVFVLPFECRNEVEYLIEFYNIRKFVRYIEASHIDNELDLKHRFHLL
ncbi:MAG: CRISPR-associated endonuclease Cas2 [Patescibacteria group bacterium]